MVGVLNITGFELLNSRFPTTRYRLTAVPTLPDSNTTLNLLLSDVDLNAIKQNTNLAVSATTTFLSVSEVAITDSALNPVESISEADSLIAVPFVADTTPPTLVDFVLDLNSSAIIFTFSEIVMASSFQTNLTTLLSSNVSTALNYTLQSTLRTTVDSNIINLPLSLQDGDQIKLTSGLGSAVDNTFISLLNNTITDFNNNRFEELDSPRQASTVISDELEPSLTSYTLDVNSGRLDLQFTEPIDISSINIPGITLYSADGNMGPSVTLSDSVANNTENASLVVVELSDTDLNNIRFFTNLGVQRSNTFLTLASGSFTDLANNLIQAIVLPGQQALMVTGDISGPVLESFTFDLNSGHLSLTFDEIINVFTANGNGFTLLNAANGPEMVTLTAPMIFSDNRTVLTLVLSNDDLNSVKAFRNLATSESNTFLAMDSSAIEDVSDNSVQEILMSNPLMAQTLFNDTTSPRLLSFLINIDTGNITLIFSETVNVRDTLMPTEILFQDTRSASPNVTIRLSNMTTVQTQDSNIVTVSASQQDVNRLFSNQLCLNESACFLAFSENLVSDMSGNRIMSQLGEDAIQVNQLIIDPNPPQLAQFSEIDFNQGTLTLRFTKTILPNTFMPQNITLSSTSTLTGDRIELMGGTVLASLGPEITFELERNDLNTLKLDRTICGLQLACFIRFPQGTVLDLAMNPVEAVDFGTISFIEAPQTLIGDTTGPRVVAYDLDLNLNTLMVEFDEPIQDFTASQVTVQDAFNASINFTLSASNVMLQSMDTVATVFLQPSDIVALKSTDGLASDNTTTFFTHTAAIANDLRKGFGTGENPAMPAINGVNSIQVRTFTPDTTPPIFTEFTSFDLNSGELTITFNEPVDIDTIAYGNFTLLPSSSAATGVTISQGNVQYVDSSRLSIELTISLQDLELVKSDLGLASERSTTFLRVDPGAITDTSDTVLSVSRRLQVVDFLPDRTSPNLLSFNFDLDTGLLQLTFDEIVDGSTIQFRSFTFQNNFTSPTSQHTLSGGPDLSSMISNEIDFNIERADLDMIRGIMDLATNISDTFLNIIATAIRDLAGQNVNGVTRQVTNFTGDDSQPRLISYNLNVGLGTLVLEFSEAVAASTLDVTQITLLNGPSLNASNVTLPLRGGSFDTNLTASVISVTLIQSDADVIRTELEFFGGADTTYLSISEGAVSDPSGNPLVGISSDNPLNVTEAVIDQVPPELASFSLDLDSGVLQLSFTEVVDTSRVSVSGFVLTDDSPPGVTYALTTSSVDFNTSTIFASSFNITLSDQDLNSVKSMEELGNDVEDTFLQVLFRAVLDTNSVPIQASDPVPAVQVTGDESSPSLVEFELDLNSNVLALTFGEALNLSTVMVDEITLSSLASVSDSSAVYTLNSSSVTPALSNVLSISLSDNDVDSIKVLSNLANNENDTFISFSSNLGADFAGNFVEPISGLTSRRARTVTRDSTPPTLTSYSLDLDEGVLDFTFSEPINVSSIEFGGITLLTVPLSADRVTLTSGEVSPSNQRTVSLTLSPGDLDAVKLVPLIGRSAPTTYLELAAGSFEDVAGTRIVAVTGNSAVMARAVVQDTTPPELLSFEFLMNNGRLPLDVILNFNEAVDINSIVPSLLTLSTSPNDTNISVSLDGVPARDITDIPLENGERRRIRIRINILIIIEIIRNRPPLGQSESTTAIIPSPMFVEDARGNSYNRTDIPIPLVNFTADFIRPELDQFNLDLDAGTILLSFSEEVVLPLNTSGLMLLGLRSLSGRSLTPADSTVSRPMPSVVQVLLTTEELNSLKAMSMLGTMTNNTFVSIEEGSILDLAQNPLVGVGAENATAVTTLTLDTTAPRIVNFSLALDRAEIVLTFSETVDASTLMTSEITLQNAPSNAPSQYTLTGGTVADEDRAVLAIAMSEADINAIQSMGNLANTGNDVYLVATRDTVLDTSGNRLVAISNTNALPVGAFNLDTANPNLVGFDFNLNASLLVLSFDEFVNVSSLMISELTLQDGFSAMAAEYSLRMVERVDVRGRNIEITLSAQDLNAIKLLPLCSSGNDCYLSYSNETVRDSIGLPLNPRPDGNALNITGYTPDSTPPALLSFVSLDLVNGTISLSFSEAVNVSTIDTQFITLQTLFEEPILAYNLTGGEAVATNSESTAISITLNAQDINFIKRDRHLCTIRPTCYFVASSLFLEDTFGNQFMAIAQEFPGFIVGDLIDDDQGPVLQFFHLDLDDLQLTIRFDEPVDVSTFIVSALTIQSAANISEADSSYQLTTSTTSTENVQDVTIFLSAVDANNLKLINASNGPNTTFLSALAGFVLDTAFVPNRAREVPSGSALRVSNYTADMSPPVLTDFSINLRTEVLTLTFDEPVIVETFNTTGLLLHSGPSQSGNLVRLEDGVIQNTERAATVISVALSREDIAAVKLDGSFGTASNNTFLSIDAESLEDTSENAIDFTADVMVSSLDEVTAVSFATLDAFTLDLNTGDLILTFSDVMNVSTQYPPALRLQSRRTAGTDVYTLSSDSLSSSPDGHIVRIELSALDLLQINSIATLAIDRRSTYLIMRADYIDDYIGNDVLPITNGKALQVSEFVRDSSPPELLEAVLDLNVGALNISFSDAINLGAINVTGIAIQNEAVAASGSIVITLTGTDSIGVSADGRTVVLSLTMDDLRALITEPNIGTDGNNTFLTIEQGSFQDFFANIVNGTPADSAFGVGRVIEDISGPTLMDFVLDFNSGLLNITFSESINASSFNPRGLTLQSTQVSDAVSYTLTTGVVEEDDYFVSIQLEVQDLNAINIIPQLGNSENDTFITVQNFAFSDLSGNPAVVILSTSALQADEVVPDSASPSLASFSLDLDTGVLRLTFSEFVLPSSLNSSEIVLQSEQQFVMSTTQTLTLAFVPIQQEISDVVNVTLTDDDLNFIKAASVLGEDVNSTFISLSEDTVMDLSDIPVVPILQSNARRAEFVVPDRDPPFLSNFTLDLGRNILSLTFSETISLQTLNVSLITLQDTASAPVIEYTLTTSSPVSSPEDRVSMVEISLSVADLNSIKVLPIGITPSNTFLLPGNGTVADIAGNLLVQPAEAVAAFMVIPDSTPPALRTFTLDLNASEIILTFNEAVDVMSLNVSGLTVIPQRGMQDPSRSLTLTGGLSSINFQGDEVTIALTMADEIFLKGTQGVGETVNNTFLTLVNGTISDTFGFEILEIMLSEAVQAMEVVADETGPLLLKYTIDLDTGLMVLTFDEPVSRNISGEQIEVFSSTNSTSALLALQASTSASAQLNVLTITLMSQDLDRIKPLGDQIYLRLVSGGVLDISGNGVESVEISDAVLPSNVTLDTTRPRLLMFHIDLTNATISLFFDEATDPSTVDLSRLTLQNAAVSENVTFTPTGGIVMLHPTVTSALVINITEPDLNEMYRLPVCTNTTDCYITYPSTLVQDYAGNDVVDRSGNNTTPLQASMFSPDSITPQLESFATFDLDTGVLTLNFSETVRASSINFDGAMIVSFDVNPRFTLRLNGGTTASENGLSLQVQLTPADLTSLKLNNGLCTDLPNCYLNLPTGAIRDMAGNPIQTVILRASSFIDDTSGPLIVGFEFDLNAGRIALTFNEPVNLPNSGNFAAITIQNAPTSTTQYRLNGGTSLTTAIGPVIEFTLLQNDLNSIKSISGLATSMADTYLTATSALSTDVSVRRLPNIALVNGVNAIQAMPYVIDMQRVNLQSFQNLDLDVGTLQFRFDEPVDLATIQLEQFTIQSSVSNGILVQLMGGMASYGDTLQTIVNVQLSRENIVDIKANAGIGNSVADTFLSAEETAIRDVSGNLLTAIPSTAAVVVQTVTLDSSFPSLVGFTLDMNSGVVTLNFDDVMDVSTFTPSALSIQSERSSSAISRSLDTPASSVITADDGFDVQFNLSLTDFRALQGNSDLATDLNNTFLVAPVTTISAANGFPIVTRLSDNAFQATNHVPDTTNPSIEEFTLDLNSGLILLTFSEVVNTSTFDVTQITVQDTVNGTGDSLNFTEGSILQSDPSHIITVQLTFEDLESIKNMMDFGVSNTTTFLTATNETVSDTVGLPLEEILPTNALMVSVHLADMTGPLLTNFSLDLNSGLVAFTFDETVLVSTFNIGAVTVQSDQVRVASTTVVSLSGGMLAAGQTDGTVVMFFLSAANTDQLNTDQSIARTEGNTFLSLAEGVVLDTNQVPAMAIPASNALPVGEFFLDGTRPILEGFDLDIDAGVLVLSFNELVSPGSFVSSSFTIQSENGTSPSSSFTLPAGLSPTTTADNDTLTLILPVSDLNTIKSDFNLSTSENDTFLSVISGAVVDIFLNPLEPISPELALPVSVYTRDITRPDITSISADFNANQVTFGVSEPIDPASFDPSQITIMSSAVSPVSYVLTGGEVQVNGTEVVLSLSDADVSFLKQNSSLATSMADTLVSATPNTFSDTAGNTFVGITVDRARPVDDFSADNMPPRLLSFSYEAPGDRAGVVLRLVFSEVIDTSSLNVSEITLQESSDVSMTGESVVLTGGAYSEDDVSVLSINITDEDYATILSREPLGTSINTTYLSITSDALTDLIGLFVVQIAETAAQQASVYSVDLVRPELQAFTYDLNSDSIILTFNEVMDEGSYNASEFTIQSSSNDTSISYTLTGGVASSSGNRLTIALSGIDLDELNLNPDLATDENTTYISFTEFAIQDVSNNRVVPVPSSNAEQVSMFVADASGPRLVSFTLNLDTQSLGLSFSETINITSLELTEITLQNAPVNASESFSLTGGSYLEMDASFVLVNLTEDDYHTLQTLTDLGSFPNNTFISFTSDLLADFYGFAIEAIDADQALSASSVGMDTMAPSLLAFDFDMNSGIITLSFDEVVEVDSFQPEALQVQNTSTQAITLTANSTVVSLISDVVSVQLSDEDLDNVKAARVCIERESCYISYSAQLITDAAELAVVPSSPAGIQVSNHTRDIVSPSLVEFVSFDLNFARFSLQFSESVDTLTLNFSGVTIQSFASGAVDELQLNSGTVSESGPTINISLSTEDAIRLKQNPFLCGRQGTCYVTLTSVAIDDMTGNSVVPVDTGVLVEMYTGDDISPSLERFELNIDTGELVLSFDEIVDTRNLLFSGIVIQSTDMASPDTYRLSGGTRTSNVFSETINIMLSMTDLNGIKATSFAKSMADTYITIEPTAITDLSPSSNPAIRTTRQVDMYVSDNVIPTLLSYHLDLDSNLLLLTFDEPMREDLLRDRISSVSFSSTATGADNYTLTGGEITATDQRTVIRVALNTADIIGLQYNGNPLASSSSRVFLSIAPSTISDTGGLFLREVVPLQAQPPNLFTPGTSPLNLESFTLDIFNGVLILTFNDVVNASTFNPGGLTFVNEQGASTHLLDATTMGPDGLELVVNLGPIARNTLAASTDVATSIDNTFLSITPSVISRIVTGDPVLRRERVQASVFIGGGNSSELSSFTLDMNTGVIAMQFSQPISASTFDPLFVRIQDERGNVVVNLTGGVSTSAMQNFQLNLALTPDDLDALNAEERVALSPTSTYLFIASGPFSDVNGNTVSTSEPVQAMAVVADSQAPTLSDFTLDLNNGRLILTFSETVIARTLDLELVTVQNSGATISQRLSDGTLLSGNGRAIATQLSREDLRFIRADDNIGTDTTNTFLTFADLFVADAFGNRASAVSGVQAATVLADTSDPTLEAFTLNLDNNASVILTFSEVVEIAAFATNGFTLQSTRTSTATSQNLGPSSVITASDSDVIEIELARANLFPIQQDLNFGTAIANTFISVTAGSAVDKAAASNTLAAIPSTMALQASEVIADMTSPMLEAFTLDLGSGTVSLTFNEVIDTSSFNPEQFVFQNAAFSAADSTTFANTSTIVRSSMNTVDVELSREDFDRIRVNPNLGTATTNSYLNLTFAAVRDTSGNPNVAAHEAVQATNVAADATLPVLQSVEVNMDMGVLVLSYSEAINVELFEVTGITLYNSMTPTPAPSFQLTPASFVASPSGSTVVVDINGDLNPIREAMTSFGSSTANTFYSIAANTAYDFSNNTAAAVLTPTSPDLVNADNVGPALRSFELDLNTGVLTLRFAETLVESTFNTSQIMLQNARRDAIEHVAITSTSYQRVNLSNVVIILTESDVDAINVIPELGTGVEDTFLTITGTTAEDVLGNPSVSISMQNALQVSEYVRDRTGPEVVDFRIDLNANTITFRFNEVPDPRSVNMSVLTVQNTASIPSALNFTFTGREASRTVGRTVIIDLTQEDVDTLNTLDICTSTANCFAMFEAEFITDAAGNQVLPSPILMATNFTTDMMMPRFEQFIRMDIDEGTIILEFSETIDASTVQLNMLTLQSASIGGGADFTTVTLSGGEIVSGSSSQLEIRLLTSDLNMIKRSTVLCVRRTDCYVRFPGDFARDAFGNSLPPVANSVTPSATDYPLIFVSDTTGPIIQSFNLDLENALLEIAFNELILSNTFTVTQLTFQDGPFPTTSYTLTGIRTGSVLQFNDTGVSVPLSDADVALLKANPALVTRASNTYLTNSELLVQDFFRNQATVRSGVTALRVSEFGLDTTPPTFAAFVQFSQELAQIALQFSEPIDVTTVNFSQITLQASQAMGALSLQLSQGSAELAENRPQHDILTLTLSLDDQFVIKQMGSMLAINTATTFLSFAREAFSDTAGNVLVAGVSSANAVQPVSFIPDALAPMLAGFELNMEESRVLLTYDDIINPTVYTPTGITFQNQAVFPTQVYTLTGGSTQSTEMLGFVINATITPGDLLQLKHRLGLATSTLDTFIRGDATVTVSATNAPIMATTGDAVQATSFIRDQTPPTISAFSLNLTTEILSVVADEPLDPARYDGTGVTFQNSPNSTGLNIMSVTLTGGTAMQSPDSIFQLDVMLANFDLNQLKQMLGLATHMNNVYLSLESTAFADFGGNGVDLISGMQALDVTEFGGDLVSPTLSQFTLDLDAGQITLSFSEVVDAVIFDPSSIALQSAQGVSEVFRFTSLTEIPSPNLLNNLTSDITYQFPLEDLNALKLDPSLSAFALLDSDTTVDSNGHSLIGSLNQSALPVTILPDTTGPLVQNFTMNVDTGVFDFEFDEPILLSSVNPSALSVTFDRRAVYNVSDANVTLISPRAFRITITIPDLLDLLDIIRGMRDCDYVFFSSDFASDISNNPIAPVSIADPLQADVFVPDMTSPRIVSFDLDMNTGLLVLNFSEGVIAESLNTSLVTIQNAPNGRNSYTLQGPSTLTSTSPRSLSVSLSSEDLAGIKAARDTATSRTNTYLTNMAGVVSDFFQNPASEISSASAIQVTIFQEDLVSPEFVSFSFGALNGRVSLSLTFNEVIDSTSVNVSQLLLSSEANISSPTAQQFRLTSSTPLDSNSEVIVIPLSDNGPNSDLFSLIAQSPSLDFLGQFANSTYLYFPSGVAADVQGLPVAGLSIENTFQTTQEPGDLVPPQLLEWNLNLDMRTAILVFTEEVEIDSFDFTAATLYGSQSNSALNYTLTGGNVTQINGSRYMVFLTSEDINGIQAVENLGVSATNTYIALTRGLATDQSGLDVLPIDISGALQTFNLTTDTNPPELIRFELSLSGDDPLILTFSETVMVSTFDLNFIALHGARSPSASIFMLSPSTTVLTTRNSPTIELRLTVADKALLQQMPDLATTVRNTFISITPRAVMDTDMNSVVEITVENAIQASVVIPDTLPPFVSEFEIDMKSRRAGLDGQRAYRRGHSGTVSADSARSLGEPNRLTTLSQPAS